MHSRNHRRGWRPRLTAALMLTFGTWANPIEAQQVQGGVAGLRPAEGEVRHHTAPISSLIAKMQTMVATL